MKKGKKVDPPRFSDNPKYPPKKNLAKTPRIPSWISNFQLLCIYDVLTFVGRQRCF